MENTQETPLWLELKTQYIDDNFEKLVPYLRSCQQTGKKDAFYQQTIELLRRRVQIIIQEVAQTPLYAETDTFLDREFRLRLLGVYLLSDPNNPLSRDAFVAFMYMLLPLASVKFIPDILKTVMGRLKKESQGNYGFTWEDLQNILPEVLVHKIISCPIYSTFLQKHQNYDSYGTATLTSEGLFLSSQQREQTNQLFKNGSASLECGLDICALTKSQHKLKQGQGSDMKAMESFTKDFLQEQSRNYPKPVVKHLKTYTPGEKLIVQITEIKSDIIYVISTDDRYEPVSGTVVFSKSNFIYYSKQLFPRYLKAGDYIPAIMLSHGQFDIEKTFIEFVVEDCRNTYGENGETSAVLISRKNSGNVWMNERGVPLYTQDEDFIEEGSVATLCVKRYGTGSYYGKIDAELVEFEDNPFDVSQVQKDCIEDFANSELPEKHKTEEENFEALSGDLLSLLNLLLFCYQKTLSKPSERYRVLCLCRILANLMADKTGVSYLQYESTYLRIITLFAKGEDIHGIALNLDAEYEKSPAALTQKAVVQLLQEYGKKNNSEVLSNAISTYETLRPEIAKLARLIQTANSMIGLLSNATINVVKQEIIRALSLEMEENADLESEGAEYLGIESGTQEFKTSMVYPPGNHMQPNQTEQNANVLKGICAFLNSTTGGVLYLGVNDQGYISGLDQDMKQLQFSDMDHYIRYVQDRIIEAFGKDVMMCISPIEPLYQNRVLAVHVSPHPYRVVELHEKAYLRVNAESREMSESVKQELLAQKVFRNKDRAAALSLLQQAESRKLCVILHNYASSNSGQINDRKVEAYKILPEDNLVICYDLDKQRSRVFNLCRIGYVEILEKEPWKFVQKHQDIQVDAFHMTGMEPIQVSLQLDLFSKNLLTEEFPRTKDDVSPDKKEANVWYYSGQVYNIMGIARFYMGLANHIKILQCPELEEYVRQFCKDYLK